MKRIVSTIEETGEDNLTPSRLSSVRDTITTSQESAESSSETPTDDDDNDEEPPNNNIPQDVDKLLLSALSAASVSNVAEIRKIQILLLQEENHILHREVAQVKSQLRSKQKKIDRLQKQLKEANSMVIELARNKSKEPGQHQSQIHNMMQIVNEKLRMENGLHQKTSTVKERGNVTIPLEHSTELTSTPRCKRKSLDDDDESGQPQLIITDIKTDDNRDQISGIHRESFSQRTSISVTEDLSPKLVDRLESALRKTPRLASTDEVDFLVSSDTYQGAGACISEYLSDADYSACLSESNTSLTMMSRSSARFGSASRKTITPPDSLVRTSVSPTLMPGSSNHKAKTRPRLPSEKSPLLSPSEPPVKVTTPSTAMSSSAVRSSDTEICNKQSKSPPRVLAGGDDSGKIKMVPSLRLSSVGESGWMSGKHTSGDTYHVDAFEAHNTNTTTKESAVVEGEQLK